MLVAAMHRVAPSGTELRFRKFVIWRFGFRNPKIRLKFKWGHACKACAVSFPFVQECSPPPPQCPEKSSISIRSAGSTKCYLNPLKDRTLNKFLQTKPKNSDGVACDALVAGNTLNNRLLST